LRLRSDLGWQSIVRRSFERLLHLHGSRPEPIARHSSKAIIRIARIRQSSHGVTYGLGPCSSVGINRYAVERRAHNAIDADIRAARPKPAEDLQAGHDPVHFEMKMGQATLSTRDFDIVSIYGIGSRRKVGCIILSQHSSTIRGEEPACHRLSSRECLDLRLRISMTKCAAEQFRHFTSRTRIQTRNVFTRRIGPNENT
jgi:hypothetical protein